MMTMIFLFLIVCRQGVEIFWMTRCWRAAVSAACRSAPGFCSNLKPCAIAPTGTVASAVVASAAAHAHIVHSRVRNLAAMRPPLEHAM
jgi:hypothetical protein